MPGDKARDVLHAAYMQGYRDGQQALLAGRRHTPRRRVVTVLLERLEAKPQPAELMLSLASELGVHTNTLRAAKVEARIESYRDHHRGCWMWAHPRHATQTVGTKTTSQLDLLSADPINPYTDDCETA